MKALQKYAGPLKDLSPPEQFLLIMSSIPRLNEKIHLLMLMHQFEVPSYIQAIACDSGRISFCIYSYNSCTATSRCHP